MRKIKNVAIIGSGIMGSRIACHFANIGVQVLLLDISPKKLIKSEENQGLSLSASIVRNRIVKESLDLTLKSKPSPIYNQKFKNRISIGNLIDDLEKVHNADWIIEVIVENLEIKKQLFIDIEKHRKPGTIISSNTSGIPINKMIEGRSEDFCKYFCGTHFFNPPRYLKLLEIIPSNKTEPNLISFLMNYGEKFLGKKTVLCKDTPAFIANRVGIAGIAALFKLSQDLDMTIDEIDLLTGPIIGRPKSATFRTSDLVGLDTLHRVAEGVFNNCPNDEQQEIFQLPEFIQKMLKKIGLEIKQNKVFIKSLEIQKGIG